MNIQRRKEITTILNELTVLRFRVETLQNEEQDAFDNMPEGLQKSDCGEKIEEGLSSIDNALSAFDAIETELNAAAK